MDKILKVTKCNEFAERLQLQAIKGKNVFTYWQRNLCSIESGHLKIEEQDRSILVDNADIIEVGNKSVSALFNDPIIGGQDNLCLPQNYNSVDDFLYLINETFSGSNLEAKSDIGYIIFKITELPINQSNSKTSNINGLIQS